MHQPASVRPARRPHRRGLSALVVAAVVAGTAPALTSTAHAAGLPVWTAGTSVTQQMIFGDSEALVRTDDGTDVVLFNQELGSDRAMYAAVRPAGTEVWGAPVLLSVTAQHPGQGRLVTVGNKVVAAWTDYPASRIGDGGKTPGRIVTATLDKGTWSAPTVLLGTDQNRRPSEPDLAAGADGTIVVTWQQRRPDGNESSVWAATRSGAGAWSAPAQVSNAAGDGDAGAGRPQAAVDAKGTPVVAFHQQTEDGGSSIRTSTLPAGASAWPRPTAVAESAAAELGEPALTSSASGTVALTWSEPRPAQGDRLLRTATAPGAAEAWSAAEPLTVAAALQETPEPLIEPDGDVTLVWNGGPDRGKGRIRSATLDHTDRRWSAVGVVSTKDHSINAEDHSVSLGKDGTIWLTWAQSADRQEMRQARLKDGVWSGSARLWNSSADEVKGLIAAGADGSATAVWDRDGEGDMGLMSAHTTDAPLSVASSSVPAEHNPPRNWSPRWQLSRPVSSWTVTLTDATGTFRSTVKGGMTVTPSLAWSGEGDDKTTAPNGPMTWTLTATPLAGDTGVRTLATGTITVAGGHPSLRDQGSAAGRPDGIGDALVLTSGGGLRSIFGDRATGAFKGTATGSGWPAGTLPVPVKDAGLDRCNDLLVRNSKGELRRYTPGCGKTVTPTTTHKLIGGGWNQYDVLTSPGDYTGGGPAELVARNASTGALYRYARANNDTLGPRVQIPGSYKDYKKILGAGDLNGDRYGDLVLQDKANRLWRMNGTAKGSFAAPVKISDSWGSTYNSVVAAGDLTGDGRADLLARDTSGVIWRIPGTGKGTLGSRVKIATGWQIYKGLY
ncbi:FG-GAP-like repeat-containing protein [Streptomyces sp. AP-93]|uniref:FG-GAP-like repeat-containing protein n=1 Tax=Streptomyces sp. AP-93 TaxID=2929048 RepID=UPI001FAF7B53|nr:FG-GAP-like repeat-containing protein [Streptomyces sp. AP-93]MCJ0874146.1 FG-GAP-like repeat-containing protein [Streptomyces sp. AP-93]